MPTSERPTKAPLVPGSPTESPLVPSAQPCAPPTFAPLTAALFTTQPTAAPTTPSATPSLHASVVTAAVLSGAGQGLAQVTILDFACRAESELPLALHPTQIELAGSAPVGTLVGAVIVVAGAAVLAAGAAHVLCRLGDEGHGVYSREAVSRSLRHVPLMRDAQNADLGALARHPSTALGAVYAIYQGASFSGLRLLLGGGSTAWQRGVGGLASAAALALPFWVRLRVARALYPKDGPGVPARPAARVREWDAPQPAPSVQLALLSAQGDWVSCSRDRHWINSWQAAVRPYTAQRAADGACAELLAMWLLAAAAAPTPGSWRGCGHQRVAGAAPVVLYVGWIALSRPYRSPRDTALTLARLAALAAAQLALAIGYYGERDGAAPAGALFWVAAAAALLRCVVLLAAEAALLGGGWRATAQVNEWGPRAHPPEPVPTKQPSPPPSPLLHCLPVATPLLAPSQLPFLAMSRGSMPETPAEPPPPVVPAPAPQLPPPGPRLAASFVPPVRMHASPLAPPPPGRPQRLRGRSVASPTGEAMPGFRRSLPPPLPPSLQPATPALDGSALGWAATPNGEAAAGPPNPLPFRQVSAAGAGQPPGAPRPLPAGPMPVSPQPSSPSVGQPPWQPQAVARRSTHGALHPSAPAVQEPRALPHPLLQPRAASRQPSAPAVRLPAAGIGPSAGGLHQRPAPLSPQPSSPSLGQPSAAGAALGVHHSLPAPQPPAPAPQPSTGGHSTNPVCL
eukprot:TRINITY_DN23700_c0_g1_i1.p2 TRINITY_DN23700_c0_g1~~TRINITY_DN23700_c0_g1_i1.p2  ORF type:complete len:755 (+),score=134.07 TRINITY_DN23700_c0_g1_i1:51-2267(+)